MRKIDKMCVCVCVYYVYINIICIDGRSMVNFSVFINFNLGSFTFRMHLYMRFAVCYLCITLITHKYMELHSWVRNEIIIDISSRK